MRQHLLGPEQALMRNYYAEVNRLAWLFRKVTGSGELRFAMLTKVPEDMRDDVLAKIKELQTKHGVKEEG